MKFWTKYSKNQMRMLQTSKFVLKSSDQLFQIKKVNFSVEGLYITHSHFVNLFWLTNKKPFVGRAIAPYTGNSTGKRLKFGKRIKIWSQISNKIQISKIFDKWKIVFLRQNKLISANKKIKIAHNFIKIKSLFYPQFSKKSYLPQKKNIRQINLSLSIPAKHGTLFFRLFLLKLLNMF